MSASSELDPGEFISSVQPLLEAQDLEGLLGHLRNHYTLDDIEVLLKSPNHDARKVAALALSLVGCVECIPAVAQCLKEKDPMVNQMAEHALWSIWFRCGTAQANSELAHGAQCLTDRRFECAFEHFDHAIELCPGFAEPYNQRAIAHYLLEQYEPCIADCQRTVELMPCHFGAWAGMGHGHAHLSRPAAAIKCYRQALTINPHLDCLKQAIQELRKHPS